MLRVASIVLVIGILSAMVPPAAAFHGTPYTLSGYATWRNLPTILPIGPFAATLDWSGLFGPGGGQFRLVITDPILHRPMVNTIIGGREDIPAFFTGTPSCGSLEVVEPYVGYDTNTNGGVFRVAGHQDNCLGGERAGQRYMFVQGYYTNQWSLRLSTGAAF